MWYIWPKCSTVRIVSSDIFQGDAIGNFNLQIRDFLASNNIPCKLYATNYDPGMGFDIAHFDMLFDEYNKEDVLLSHFSIYEERNNLLTNVSLPKAVYYHGITPPGYFVSYDDLTANNCSKGLQQFNCFYDFDYYLSNSKYMLDQIVDNLSASDSVIRQDLLDKSTVIPPFLSTTQWLCEPKRPENSLDADIMLLYVGRIAPHKCVHELFDVLKILIDRGEDASLNIVGACATVAYCEELNQLLEHQFRSIKDRVVLLGHVEQQELKYLYEKSSIFITMSEHEGYCVPLVEAMQFSLPVIARGAAAIPETMAKSGFVFYDKNYNSIADRIVALKAPDEKRSLLSRQNAVFSDMLKKADGELLLSLFEKLIQKNKHIV